MKSSNLKQWEKLSDFGLSPNEGDKSGVWECPALLTLKDEQGNEHDILFVSENGDAEGSLLQYFVGKFDGTTFQTYDQERLLWAENAFDNYAAIPYHNDPHGRAIFIGWMSNWLYANLIPTISWRGQMTIPRELSLKTIDGNVHLIQRPVDELNKLIDNKRTWSLQSPMAISGSKTVDFTSQIPFKTGSMLSLEYEIDIRNAASGKITLQFGNNQNEFVTFSYDMTERIYEFDRSKSGNITFGARFADRTARAERIATNNILSGRIILDIASIEIFADDGLNVFSAIYFPSEIYEKIEVITALPNADTSVSVQKLSVSGLEGIWHNSAHKIIPQMLTLTSIAIFIYLINFLRN